MEKISSRMTFFNKRVFPALFLGFATIFLLFAVYTIFFQHQFLPKDAPPAAVMITVPLLMLGFGFVLFKNLCFDLMDEVYDCGDGLLVRNGGKEDRIGFNEISNISYAYMQNPQKVTLSIRRETAFGHEVSFAPPVVWFPFAKSPIVKTLIDKVEHA